MTDMKLLEDWLAENGFTPRSYRRRRDFGANVRTASFLKDHVQVVFEDREAAYVTIYVYEPGPARLLMWEATLAGAPNVTVQQVIQSALDSVAATRIPVD